MSMALKYGMMKRAKKMAEGGDVKGVHTPMDSSSKNMRGKSEAGWHARNGKDMPELGIESSKNEHRRVLHEIRSMKKPNLYAEGGEVCQSCQDGTCMEHGGDDDMVSRIMQKHYSEGGMLSNRTPITADFEDNEFDDLVKDDELESTYTGANSGDEIGNSQEDEDRRDIVSRIMRSRAKGDKMPRPA